jgi:periplasmic protein TonB
MRARHWLVGVSLVLHIAVIFGLFVAGMWRVDQLDPAKHHIDLAVQLPPPAAPAGGPTLKAQPFTPKPPRHKPPVLVQIEKPVTDTPTTATEIGGPGLGSGIGSGDGPPDSEGPCLTDCGPGSAAAPEPVKASPPGPTPVAPMVLRGLRISGETQIQANDVVKTQMHRDGKDQVTAMFKVCLSARGDVSSLSMLRSSGYSAYDADLLAAIRAWRYRPFLVNTTAIPVCGVVSFIYGMK